MENERNLKMLMLHSYLISRFDENIEFDDEFTEEDIYYMRDYSIYNSRIILYIEVIKQLSLGKSYEEIMDFIDNYNINESECLNEKQKQYIKSKTKRDLMRRKMSFEKGEDIYE